MPDNLTIRAATEMADMNATVSLQKAVWQMQDVEVASSHTLRAIAHSGGCVLVAEAAGRMIGFCTGFAAWRAGQLSLWSHMAAVLPAYQGQGIGFQLKQAQRQWALARGYRLMAWTFDPLQSGNANFNFNRLGVTARHYSANHYGAMQDSINAGLASDRLEARWQLDAPQVVDLARGLERQDAAALAAARKLVYVGADGKLQSTQPAQFDAALYAIQIPRDIAALKERDIKGAQAWQLQLRGALRAAFAAGYHISAFARADACWYLLSRLP